LTAIILCDAVVGSAFDMAILRLAPLVHDDDRQYSWQLQQAGLVMKASAGILTAAVLGVFGKSLSRVLFHDERAVVLLYLTALTTIGVLLLRSVQAHFQVNHDFRQFGLVDLLHSLARYGGSGVLIALQAVSPLRVLIIFALAPIVLTAGLMAGPARKLLSVPLNLHAFTQVLGFVKTYVATTMVGSIATRMDLFFVSSLATVSEAGQFGAAQTLVLIPQLVGMYAGVVFGPRVMPMWKTGKLVAAYQRFQTAAIAGCVIVYLLAVTLAAPITRLVFPARFGAAAVLTVILLPVGLAGLMKFPWTVSVLLFSRPRFLLVLDILLLPLLAAAYMLVIPKYGAQGAAFITMSYALGKTATLQWLGWRTLKRPPLAFARIAAKAEPQLEPSGSFV
jgi:O-antigen/teichoic acid export membrane protein